MEGKEHSQSQRPFIVKNQRTLLRWGPAHLKFSAPDKKMPTYYALALCWPPTGKVHQRSDSQIPHERSYFCQRRNCELALEVKPPTGAPFTLPLPADAAKAKSKQGQQIQARKPVCLGRKQLSDGFQFRKFYWMYFILLHCVKNFMWYW